MTPEFLWEALLLVRWEILGTQMSQLKIILQWLFLNPFNTVEIALKWERTEKSRRPPRTLWMSSGKRF